jgi:hypothetical protein
MDTARDAADPAVLTLEIRPKMITVHTLWLALSGSPLSGDSCAVGRLLAADPAAEEAVTEAGWMEENAKTRSRRLGSVPAQPTHPVRSIAGTRHAYARWGGKTPERGAERRSRARPQGPLTRGENPRNGSSGTTGWRRDCAGRFDSPAWDSATGRVHGGEIWEWLP